MSLANKDADQALKRRIVGYEDEDFDNDSKFIAQLIMNQTPSPLHQRHPRKSRSSQKYTQLLQSFHDLIMPRCISTPKIGTQKDVETSTEVVSSGAKKVADKILNRHIETIFKRHMKLSRAPRPGEFDFGNPYHASASYYDHPEHGRLHKDTDAVKTCVRNEDFKHTRSGTCVFILPLIDEVPNDIRQIDTFIEMRGGSHGAGQWALAGGHQDIGESLERCAAREVMEELSIEIQDAQSVGITCDNFIDPEKGKKNYNTHWMVALMKNNKSEPVIPENEQKKVLAWRRIKLGDLEEGVKSNPQLHFYCLQQLFREEPDIIAKVAQVYAEMIWRHKSASTS